MRSNTTGHRRASGGCCLTCARNWTSGLGNIPDLDALASRYGRSVRALNEGFKQAFGQTLSAYLTERRLAAAYVCLQTTDLPIKTVATRLGYASVSHFSQAFTRQFGIRPGRLRKTLLAESED